MEGQRAQQRHFNAHPAIRCKRQLFAANQQGLIIKLHVSRRHGARKFTHPLFNGRHVRANGRRRQLQHRHAVQQAEHLDQQRFPLNATGSGVVDEGHYPLTVGGNHRFNKRQRLIVIQRTEHGADRVGGELTVTAGNCLVGQAQRIAQAAVRGTGQQLQRTRLVDNVLFIEDMLKLSADLLNVERLQMELQAAREDRDRQLLRIGGRQQEFDMRRRLFQRFQQGVEAVARQHVHFIDQIDLEAATRRGVLHVVEQIAGVFHFGARGGVDLNQIDKTPLLDLTTVVAHAARGGGDPGFAVQTFCQQTGNRGFTDAAGAGKKIGVMDAT